jgi:hemoglobin
MRHDVSERSDVSQVVRRFYDKVREDDTLGPVFNQAITDWEPHLEKLTDFWEMAIFGAKGYHGNPIDVHNDTDKKAGGVIIPYHFGTWLNLWFATIDEHFEGPNADLMKFRARKMQTVLMVSIFESRNKTC